MSRHRNTHLQQGSASAQTSAAASAPEGGASQDETRPGQTLTREPVIGSPEWDEHWQAHFEKQESAKVYQLAFWPDEKRAMPADFIACALFSGIQEKDAPYVSGLEIANANDLRIVFKGRRLTQVHADVWQGIMHLARQLPEGARVRFRSRQFLRVIGRQTGKKQRDDLKRWFTDLTATSVEISDTKSKRRFWGSLLPGGATQDENDDTVYVVEINKAIAKLFAENLGAVNWEVRQRLFKKPLALWWQFYSSKFTKPVPIRELHRLSGSGSTLKEFRRKLAAAMKAVEAAGGSPSIIDRSTDSAVPTSPRRAVPAPSSPRLALPLMPPADPPVAEATKRKFAQTYPGVDVELCLADWRAWLQKSGKTAKNPDLAFLGFARRWQPPGASARRRSD